MIPNPITPAFMTDLRARLSAGVVTFRSDRPKADAARIRNAARLRGWLWKVATFDGGVVVKV
jgi:hypothetical protein